ncbi:MAG: hypothetical protein R6U19_00640, partial [Bacteroidales bacterium]
MSKDIIKADIIRLLETIVEQAQTIDGYSDKIPQIEIDLIKDNIRQLYQNYMFLGSRERLKAHAGNETTEPAVKGFEENTGSRGEKQDQEQKEKKSEQPQPKTREKAEEAEKEKQGEKAVEAGKTEEAEKEEQGEMADEAGKKEEAEKEKQGEKADEAGKP